MATYKVIQDIEAEDKLLGPLTLRQFIYAGIAAILGYLSFLVISKGAGFLAIAFLPFMFAFAFLAFPWGRDQPTEIWALAKVRFLVKPRKRIWDQSGFKELVTITAPKRIHIDYTNGLSQNEVRSRLQALAQTVDSRGWAIKNANVNMFGQPALIMSQPSTDRLMGPLSLPQQVSNIDVQAADDMLDEKNNPTAQKVDNLVNATAKAHRQKLIDQLQAPEPPPVATPPATNNFWFMNQPNQPVSAPAGAVTFNTQVVTPGLPAEEHLPGPTPEEQQLVQQLDAQKEASPTSSYYGHLHTIQPLSAQQPTMTPPQPPPMMPPQNAAPAMPFTPQPAPMPAAPQQPTPPVAPPQTPPTQQVTPSNQAAILQLANNDDLNVATLAREANRSDPNQGEVVIKLH